MPENHLSKFYDENGFALSADLLKFLLMPFVFFVLLGFPGKFGGYVSTYSNFAAPAFFILSGFFTLVPDKMQRLAKIKRALKRSAVFFAIMLISYLALNVIYLAYYDSLDIILGAEMIRKRTFFNFLIFNVWFPLPVGNGIWFIQSLTYAYLFFLVAEKIKLSKLYTYFLIIFIIFMILTGEFAAILKFPHLGYRYIPGGTVTRAIPYMLIGMVLRKNVDRLLRAPRLVYGLGFFVGLLLAVLEMELLRRAKMLIYTGHTIGFGIMAYSICCFALKKPVIRDNFFGYHGRSYARRMYALCQPTAMISWVVCSIVKPSAMGVVRSFGSIICFVICFVTAFLIGLVKYVIAIEKNNQ